MTAIVTGDPTEPATDAVRRRALATWAAAPVRYREDANAEDDLVTGGYRDRVVVELAQNAADAAGRAGVPGRLLLALTETVDGAVLVAANTGAPLDADGVVALATLRASAKRDDRSVGRFGVGFAATLAVSDEPAVLSRPLGVRFSRRDAAAATAEIAATSPDLAAEVTRRDGRGPVLRLPFPAQGEPPTGYDTVVVVPLRDADARDAVRAQLAAVDDTVLLALPGLQRIEVEVPGSPPRVLADAEDRWVLTRTRGVHPAGLLAGRPVEERERPGWQVTWAVPREAAVTPLPGVLLAPTPTDEPLGLPAVLVATLPLDPDRRHVVPGVVTDAVLAHAAAGYAELVAHLAAERGTEALALVPTGLPGGWFDAALQEAVVAALSTARILQPLSQDPVDDDGFDDLLPDPPVGGSVAGVRSLRPSEAVALAEAGDDPDVLAALSPLIAGLVAAPVRYRAALRVLGVRSTSLAEVVDQLPADRPPVWWRGMYGSLVSLAGDPLHREALAALPVPLADGRMVRGVRGLTVVTEGAGDDLEAVLALAAEHGLRAVHPGACHPMLERLGAVPAGPRELLDDPAVRDLVDGSPDAEDPDEVAAAVLALVRAARAAQPWPAGELAWLGDLALPDDTGELAPASCLAIPGSAATVLFDPDDIGVVAADLLQQWGSGVLVACGVLDGPALVRGHDVDLTDPPPEFADLAGWDAWVDEALGDSDGPVGDHVDVVATELVAVRDLDVLRSGAEGELLTALAADPDLRAALLAPVRLVTRDRSWNVVGPTLHRVRSLRIGGCAPGATRDPEADDDAVISLLPALPPALAVLDAPVRRALGAVATVTELSGPGWVAAMSGLDVDTPAMVVQRFWGALAASATELDALDLPDSVVVATLDGVVRAPVEDLVVVDLPMWAGRTGGDVPLAVPLPHAVAVADLLDLPLSSELVAPVVDGEGTTVRTPADVRALHSWIPSTWQRHGALSVDGDDVAWWVTGSGVDAVVHATSEGGAARGLAQVAGDWGARWAIAALLTDPSSARRITLEGQLDERPASTS